MASNDDRPYRPPQKHEGHIHMARTAAYTEPDFLSIRIVGEGRGVIADVRIAAGDCLGFFAARDTPCVYYTRDDIAKAEEAPDD